MNLPERISDVGELDAFLARPSTALVECMARRPGDLAILGIGGKMGGTLGRRAVNAVRAAGAAKRVFGVSRFGDAKERRKLEDWGIETIACDLLDPDAVAKLPDAADVVFMAGRKFGTVGSEEATWAMNTLAPVHVARRYREAALVVFSTGCVYPLRRAADGGCTEDDAPGPVGEYAQSCLGRERVFQHAAKAHGARVVLFRLNYAVDLRYGVLHDIARAVHAGEPVCDTVGVFNALWQGDANDYALRALDLAAAPAAILNATGPETCATRAAAEAMGRGMGIAPRYTGTFRDAAYLNDAGRLFARFGYPDVPLARMFAWQADWIARGQPTLDRPTHFEVNDGQF